MDRARDCLSRHVVQVLAPNPGPMTLEGTNTWILRDAGETVVVDPGPDLATHLARLEQELAQSTRIRVLLTHSHLDHCELVPRFLSRTGAELLTLSDGERLSFGALALHCVATPGHTADSVCYWLEEDDEPVSLLSGDTVLGEGTTVVAHPDGSLGDYLASLRRLLDDATARGPVRLLPGHGPTCPDAKAVVEGYLEHRAARLEQVRAAMVTGAESPGDIVRTVYADVDPALWPAAQRSVAAQVEYLRGADVNVPGAPGAPDPSPGRPAPPA